MSIDFEPDKPRSPIENLIQLRNIALDHKKYILRCISRNLRETFLSDLDTALDNLNEQETNQYVIDIYTSNMKDRIICIEEWYKKRIARFDLLVNSLLFGKYLSDDRRKLIDPKYKLADYQRLHKRLKNYENMLKVNRSLLGNCVTADNYLTILHRIAEIGRRNQFTLVLLHLVQITIIAALLVRLGKYLFNL